MQWLVLSWALMGGIMPQSEVAVVTAPGYGYQIIQPESACFMDLRIEAELFEHVRIWGNAETYMTPSRLMFFSPHRIDYGIGLAVFWGPVEIGATHECDHGITKATEWRPYFMQNETKIYVAVKSRIEY